MTKIANCVLSLLEKQRTGTCQAEVDAFQELLQNNGIEDVNVVIEKDGKDFFVTLSDDVDSETLIFGVDEEEDAYCTSLDDFDELADFADTIDLQPADPIFAEDGSLDLTKLSWINQSIFAAIFSEAVDDTDEKIKTVIRKGKKVKIVVKIRKKKQTPKQKAAAAKRRGKPIKKSALVKRKMSFKIGKQAGLHG